MCFCFEAEESAGEEVLALEDYAHCSVNRNNKEEQPQRLVLLPAAGDTRVSLSQASGFSHGLLLEGRPNPINLQSFFCHSSLVTIEREKQAVITDNVAENVSAAEIGDNVSDVCDDGRILRLLTKNDQRSSGSHSIQSSVRKGPVRDEVL